MTSSPVSEWTFPAFLRIPPFPFATVPVLARPGWTTIDADEVIALLAKAKVGGQFWGQKAALPEGRDIVLAPTDGRQLAEMLAAEPRERVVLLRSLGLDDCEGIPVLDDNCDPWSIAAQASRIQVAANDELALIAAIQGSDVVIHGAGPFAEAVSDMGGTIRTIIGAARYQDPFSSNELSAAAAIRLLERWRIMLDRNKAIDTVLGVAMWKRRTVDPMLWNGVGPVPHRKRIPPSMPCDRRVLAWQSRTGANVLADARARRIDLAEIEDGFIRSVGLGADCVPPLSIVVDQQGIYFDPSQPSDLESILLETDFDESILHRATSLRDRIVRGAISKYASGETIVRRAPADRRRVLVAGQVEDDRSILCGGLSVTNLELLRRARVLEPSAWIIFKPHPDVEAGHRKGDVPAEELRRYADEVERDASIAPLLDSVDAVHVITSLAGFEALLRKKEVTTHGVPFYAGWGLTRDLAPIPARRSRKLTLDELVAGSLILYPRYFDPITRLPCPAEVLIDRLETDRVEVRSALVMVRRLQGKIQRAWRKTVGVLR